MVAMIEQFGPLVRIPTYIFQQTSHVLGEELRRLAEGLTFIQGELGLDAGYDCSTVFLMQCMD